MAVTKPLAGDANWAGSGGTSGKKLNETLDDLDAAIVAVAADLDAAELTIADHETRLDAAEPTITNHETRLDAAEPTITDHETRLDAAEPTIVSHGNRLTVNEGIIAGLINPVSFQARQTTLQSLTNNAFTVLTFTTEDFDSHSGHSTSSNTSRFTVPASQAGRYELAGGVGFTANATGGRGCQWLKNGTAINGSQTMFGNAGAGLNTLIPARVIQVDLAVGDYVELAAYQNSGAALNSTVNTSDQSYMSVKRVRSTS